MLKLLRKVIDLSAFGHGEVSTDRYGICCKKVVKMAWLK
jgi:hypothetical protein